MWGGCWVLVPVMLPSGCGVGSLCAAVVGAVCALVPRLWEFRVCCIAGGGNLDL